MNLTHIVSFIAGLMVMFAIRAQWYFYLIFILLFILSDTILIKFRNHAKGEKQ